MGAARRMTFDGTRLDPRARFFLLLVPRLLARRSTATRLAGYAFELQAHGSRRLGEWCWKRAMRATTHRDEHACRALIDLCMRASRFDDAEQLVARWFEHSGVVPSIGLELAGRLAARDRLAAAHRVFGGLLQSAGEDFARQSPAPEWPDPPRAPAIESQLAGREADEKRRDELRLGLARLCFSFGAFGAVAELFERARRRVPLGTEERIARLYARWRAEPDGSRAALAEDAPFLAGALDTAPDWQLLCAVLLAAAGAGEAAAAAAENALRQTFAGHPDLESMIADCRAMLGAIAALPEGRTFERGAAGEPRPQGRGAIRKLFVCGHGWSGSGALYDALLELDGLHEMPSTPVDAYVNACTDNEMTFVQGPGALGTMWRKARDEQRLPQQDLLDLFRLHVAGGGAIRHSEHKCAKNARHLLAAHGSAYSAVFRRMIEAVAALPARAPIADLHAVLAEAAEALTSVLTNSRETEAVLFNNAVFGHQVDMLEIFRNFRAAVVVRDPRDQYADRRAQDIKHWMTPDRFVRFYRDTRLAFARGRAQLGARRAADVREVEFERFVREEAYRKDAIDWLVEGVRTRRARRRFDPERSAKNVGIHTRLLGDDERAVIDAGLARWQRS